MCNNDILPSDRLLGNTNVLEQRSSRLPLTEGWEPWRSVRPPFDLTVCASLKEPYLHTSNAAVSATSAPYMFSCFAARPSIISTTQRRRLFEHALQANC